jgi:hypothetical protein
LKRQRQEWNDAADEKMNKIINYTHRRGSHVRTPTRAMSSPRTHNTCTRYVTCVEMCHAHGPRR